MGQGPAKEAADSAATMDDTLEQYRTLQEQHRLCLLANFTDPQPGKIFHGRFVIVNL